MLIFLRQSCLKNVHKNSTERVFHLCGQHAFFSCLLEMEQEMQKEMVCIDSVRYWLAQFGYSKFSSRLAWKIIEGFTIIRRKKNNLLDNITYG